MGRLFLPRIVRKRLWYPCWNGYTFDNSSRQTSPLFFRSIVKDSTRSLIVKLRRKGGFLLLSLF